MPTARHRAASPGRPADESMMRIVAALAGSALMRSHSAKPSRSGISSRSEPQREGSPLGAGFLESRQRGGAALTAVGTMPQ